MGSDVSWGTIVSNGDGTFTFGWWRPLTHSPWTPLVPTGELRIENPSSPEQAFTLEVDCAGNVHTLRTGYEGQFPWVRQGEINMDINKQLVPDAVEALADSLQRTSLPLDAVETMLARTPASSEAATTLEVGLASTNFTVATGLPGAEEQPDAVLCTYRLSSLV